MSDRAGRDVTSPVQTKQTDRQTQKQTDREIGSQTGRWSDEQTDTSTLLR